MEAAPGAAPAPRSRAPGLGDLCIAGEQHATLHRPHREQHAANLDACRDRHRDLASSDSDRHAAAGLGTFDGDGFHFDIPAVLSGQHPLYINDGTGLDVVYVYEDKPLATPLQQVESETTIQLNYSYKITDTNICPGSGTPVTLASGVVGRQQTNVPPNANGPGQPYPYVWLSVVMNGVAIRIEMDGNDPAATFFTRYGGIWQHMLGSLAPSPSNDIPPQNHPCG